MEGGWMGPIPEYLRYMSADTSPLCCAMLIRFMACRYRAAHSVSSSDETCPHSQKRLANLQAELEMLFL